MTILSFSQQAMAFTWIEVDDATDGAQSTLPDRYLAPGLYYLAISSWDWDPLANC
jgi:hypothetical protein